MNNYDDEFGKDFQRHLLAVLLRTPGLVSRYRTALKPEYFGPDEYREIASVLFDTVDSHNQLPTESTLKQLLVDACNDEVRDSCLKIAKRLWRDDVSDSDAVAARVVEFGKRAAIINAVLASGERIEKGDYHAVPPLIDAAMQVGEDLLDVGVEYVTSPAGRMAWYMRDRKAETIPTGVAHIDAALGGGLGRGELGLVLSAAKVGKTSSLINFGYGAINQGPYNVVHYSLEMNDRKVAVRYDDRLAEASHKWKEVDLEKYLRKLNKRQAKNLKGQLIIKRYPTRTASIDTLRAHLKLLASQDFVPDMIVVDYAMIMRPVRRLGKTHHEIAGIYEDLRTLAGELNCALWTAHQAKRDALNKDTLNLADMGESFEAVQVMDVGLALMQTDAERAEGEARFFLMGVRDVEDHRTVRCLIDRKRNRLSSVALYDAAGRHVRTDADDPETRIEKELIVASSKSAGSRDGGTLNRVKKRVLKKRIADND